MSNSKIDFKIETILYQKELSFLQKEGAILLGKIQIQEDYLNYRKRNARLDADDIIEMQTLIIEFFNYLSLIDVYLIYQKKNQPLQNIDSFMSLVQNSYLTRINKFITDLKKN